MNKERIVFLDVETTGLSPIRGNHRIIEIACIEYLGDQPTGMVLTTYINPEGKKVTKDALKVHGIRNEHLTKQPLFSQLAHKILSFLEGATLIIFNAKFDIGFLEQEFKRIDQPVSLHHHCHKIICAMELAKEVLEVPRVSLQQACLRYGIDVSQREKHGAMIDTKLLADLYFKLCDSSVTPLARTPHQKKRKTPKLISIPRAYRDPASEQLVQMNFCKNVGCDNYSVAAKNPERKKARGLGNDYKLTYISKNDEHVLTCKLCGQSSVLINNRSYVEERNRILERLTIHEPSCPNTALPADKGIGRPNGIKYRLVTETDEFGQEVKIKVAKPACENVGLGIYSYPELYKKDGANGPIRNWATVRKEPNKRKGNPVSQVEFSEIVPSKRFQCKSCGTKFSVKRNPQQKHYRRDINYPLFNAMVNKGIINRVIDQHKIHPKTVYDKLAFIYQQCLIFDLWHRAPLKEVLGKSTPVLSTDRQFYLSNWGDHNMPKPTRIVNTSTVDNDSGFILAATVNFDFTSDSESIKSDSLGVKDSEKATYYRRYSQYLIGDDDIEALEEGAEIIDVDLQPPAKGILVHQTYSMAAHFYEISSLLNDCPHAVIFADRDSGFRSIIPAVFKDKIEKGRLSAFQLATSYSQNTDLIDPDTKKQLRSQRAGLRKKYPKASQSEITKMMYDSPLIRPLPSERSRSEWLINPGIRPRIVGILPLSTSTYEFATSGMKETIIPSASLHGVDNWFQILRRKVNMLERPVTSATNKRRWNAYAGYNPEWMTKLIEIQRVYNNYCMTNKRKLRESGDYRTQPTTPAMRVGISTSEYTLDDILSFSPHDLLI